MYLVTVKKGHLQLVEKDSSGKNHYWWPEDVSNLSQNSDSPILKSLSAKVA